MQRTLNKLKRRASELQEQRDEEEELLSESADTGDAMPDVQKADYSILFRGLTLADMSPTAAAAAIRRFCTAPLPLGLQLLCPEYINVIKVWLTHNCFPIEDMIRVESRVVCTDYMTRKPQLRDCPIHSNKYAKDEELEEIKRRRIMKKGEGAAEGVGEF